MICSKSFQMSVAGPVVSLCPDWSQMLWTDFLTFPPATFTPTNGNMGAVFDMTIPSFSSTSYVGTLVSDGAVECTLNVRLEVTGSVTGFFGLFGATVQVDSSVFGTLLIVVAPGNMTLGITNYPIVIPANGGIPHTITVNAFGSSDTALRDIRVIGTLSNI